MAELLTILDQELAQLKSSERNAEEQYSFARSRLKLVKTQVELLMDKIELLRHGQIMPLDLRIEPED